MEKTLFILSSQAGSSEFSFSKEDIYKVYKKNGLEKNIEIVKTSHQNHAIEAAQAFIKKDYEQKSIIVCGGDGSLNEVAGAIYPSDTALGLIPMGTGNDFSKNLNYKNFTLEKTLKRTIAPIDLIEVNGKICVNVTSLGFDTEVLSNAYYFLDKKPSLGKKAYIKSVIYSLKNIDYENLEIELQTKNGKTIHLEGEYLLLALCNGGYYGSGFNPAPMAKIDDGILNLVLAKKISLIKLLPLILKYRKGKLENSPYLDHFQVKSGTIKSQKPFKANIDGEIFTSKEINFNILPQALNWVYFED